MARVNFDDEIELDPRFTALTDKLGNHDRARGMLIRFFRLAQKHWGKDLAPIPHDIFAFTDLQPVIDSGWAISDANGVGMREKEADEHFGWYRAACELSKKGVAARKAKAPPPGAEAPPPGDDENEQAGNKPVTGLSQPVNSGATTGQHADDPPSPAPAPAPAQGSKEPYMCKPPADAEGTPRRNGKRSKIEPSPFDLDLGARWLSHAQEIIPGIKADLPGFANAVRLLRTADAVPESELERIFAFVRDDEFWRTNAVSPGGLRGKSKNGLHKLDNVRAAMERGGATSGGLTFDELCDREEERKRKLTLLDGGA